MSGFRAACAVAWLSLGVAAADVCVPAPPDLTWGEGNRGYLEFVPYTIELASGTIQTRAWKDSLSERTVLLPPPILRLRRGESYSVVVRNSLPEGLTSDAHNTLKDPNIFNLHTHGLHISGEMPADDVWRRIGFGECAEYVYHIPSEHLGGTHFYHPHHHGSTFLHISGGAMGMIIVEDDEADLIPPKVMAMTEQHIILSRLDSRASGAGGDTLFWHNGDGHTSITGNQHWTVNGVQAGHGDICIPRNTWQRWRVMLFDQAAQFWKFGLGAHNDRTGDSPFDDAPCEMQLMARDGIWRSVTPKALENSYFMPASTRVDIAIKCSGSASLSIQRWNRNALDQYSFLANVVVDPSLEENAEVGPFSNGAAGTTWSARRPDYAPGDLSAVASTELAHSEFFGLTQKLGFTVNTGTASQKEEDQTYQRFSKETANGHYSTGGVHEFNPLKSGDHSFHLHIWPLYAVSFLSHPTTDCTKFDYEAGEYYDVWRCEGVARFKTVRFAGKAVSHCHMVEHEDTGLMGWFNVSGKADEHEPNPCPQNNLYTCSDVFNGRTAAGGACGTVTAGALQPSTPAPTPPSTTDPTPAPSPAPSSPAPTPAPSPPAGSARATAAAFAVTLVVAAAIF